MMPNIREGLEFESRPAERAASSSTLSRNLPTMLRRPGSHLASKARALDSNRDNSVDPTCSSPETFSQLLLYRERERIAPGFDLPSQVPVRGCWHQKACPRTFLSSSCISRNFFASRDSQVSLSVLSPHWNPETGRSPLQLWPDTLSDHEGLSVSAGRLYCSRRIVWYGRSLPIAANVKTDGRSRNTNRRNTLRAMVCPFRKCENNRSVTHVESRSFLGLGPLPVAKYF